MKIQLFARGGKALFTNDNHAVKITIEENGVGPIQEMDATEQLIKQHFPHWKLSDIVVPKQK